MVEEHVVKVGVGAEHPVQSRPTDGGQDGFKCDGAPTPYWYGGSEMVQ